MQTQAEETGSRGRCEIVSFLSGKGGAGKTTVSLAFAEILAGLGYKVAFVDWDLHTHGASYYYVDRARTQGKKGILEIFAEELAPGPRVHPVSPRESLFSEEDPLVALTDNLSFIPSKTDFSKKTWHLTQDSRLISEVKTQLTAWLCLSNYEYVICDSQAGPTAIARLLARDSDRVVIVSEPDPLSIGASRSLDREIRDEYPPFVRFLINKLSSEEVESFRAIQHFLAMFEQVSPLPFDFSVREFTSFGKTPIDLSSPSRFAFAVLRLVSEVLPSVSRKVVELEREWRSQIFGEVEKRRSEDESAFASIQRHLTLLEERRVEVQVRSRRNVAIVLSGFLASTAFAGSMMGFFVLKSAPVVVAAGAGGAILALVPIAWEWVRTRSQRHVRYLDMEIKQLLEQLDELRLAREKLDVLVADKAKDYLLEPLPLDNTETTSGTDKKVVPSE